MVFVCECLCFFDGKVSPTITVKWNKVRLTVGLADDAGHMTPTPRRLIFTSLPAFLLNAAPFFSSSLVSLLPAVRLFFFLFWLTAVS